MWGVWGEGICMGECVLLAVVLRSGVCFLGVDASRFVLLFVSRCCLTDSRIG